MLSPHSSKDKLVSRVSRLLKDLKNIPSGIVRRIIALEAYNNLLKREEDMVQVRDSEIYISYYKDVLVLKRNISSGYNYEHDDYMLLGAYYTLSITEKASDGKDFTYIRYVMGPNVPILEKVWNTDRSNLPDPCLSKKLNKNSGIPCLKLDFMQEINALIKLRGKPNIMKILSYEHYTFRTIFGKGLVFTSINDIAGSQTLRDIIDDKPRGSLNAFVGGNINFSNLIEHIGSVFNGMLNAIQTCHSHEIIHMDGHWENWMFRQSTNESIEPILIDFGSSINSNFLKNEKGEEYHVCKGRLPWKPPEMSPDGYEGNKNITPAVDYWALGCNLRLILCKYIMGRIIQLTPPNTGTELKQQFDYLSDQLITEKMVKKYIKFFEQTKGQGVKLIPYELDKLSFIPPPQAQHYPPPLLPTAIRDRRAAATAAELLSELHSYPREKRAAITKEGEARVTAARAVAAIEERPPEQNKSEITIVYENCLSCLELDPKERLRQCEQLKMLI